MKDKVRIFNINPKKLLILVFVLTFISSFNACSEERSNETIKLGKWNQGNLQELIKEKPSSIEGQIEFLSAKFLSTPYEASTLTGDTNTPEIFTVNLEGMDCFTYIDYVEALRLSTTLEDFNSNLKDIRYQSGNISFENRNHFFSDWPTQNSKNVGDVTYQIGGSKTIEVEKNLNLKSDGSKFLPGIPVVNRKIYYIPTSEIDDDLLNKLHTGDYVGIYTDIEGLDVTHTGIIIKKDDGVYLRHASSKKKNQKVVDEDFKKYVQNTPGMVIFRPK
jgi:hypothetical protein